MKFKFLMLNIMVIVELLSMNKAEQEMSCLSLKYALYDRNMELIETILKQPLNLNILYASEDLSPLMIAAIKVKDALMVRKLLEKGASVLFKNSRNKHVMDLLMDIVMGPRATDADVQVFGYICPYYVTETYQVAENEERRRKENLIFKKQQDSCQRQ